MSLNALTIHEHSAVNTETRSSSVALGILTTGSSTRSSLARALQQLIALPNKAGLLTSLITVRVETETEALDLHARAFQRIEATVANTSSNSRTRGIVSTENALLSRLAPALECIQVTRPNLTGLTARVITILIHAALNGRAVSVEVDEPFKTLAGGLSGTGGIGVTAMTFKSHGTSTLKR